MGQFQQYQLRSELQGHDEDVRLCLTACLQGAVLALVPLSGRVIFRKAYRTPQITWEPVVLQCNSMSARWSLRLTHRSNQAT